VPVTIGDYDPSLCLGYLRLDRFGDLGPEAECPECGQPFGDGGIWLAVMGDLTLSAAVCGVCATSD